MYFHLCVASTHVTLPVLHQIANWALHIIGMAQPKIPSLYTYKNGETSEKKKWKQKIGMTRMQSYYH